jgi:hypothetical protein
VFELATWNITIVNQRSDALLRSLRLPSGCTSWVRHQAKWEQVSTYYRFIHFARASGSSIQLPALRIQEVQHFLVNKVTRSLLRDNAPLFQGDPLWMLRAHLQEAASVVNWIAGLPDNARFVYVVRDLKGEDKLGCFAMTRPADVPLQMTPRWAAFYRTAAEYGIARKSHWQHLIGEDP